jgi:hypothetical protein
MAVGTSQVVCSYPDEKYAINAEAYRRDPHKFVRHIQAKVLKLLRTVSVNDIPHKLQVPREAVHRVFARIGLAIMDRQRPARPRRRAVLLRRT